MTKILAFISVLFLTGCDHINRMKDDADAARNKSDSIMKAFKTVGKELDSTRRIFDSFAKPKPGF